MEAGPPLSGCTRGTIANAETSRRRLPHAFWKRWDDPFDTIKSCPLIPVWHVNKSSADLPALADIDNSGLTCADVIISDDEAEAIGE